jgi:hypothetical protein
MATAHGTVKKTSLAEFSRPRPSGIIAVGLDEGDYLVGVALTDGKYDVMLFSSEGKAVRFEENDVRPMGRGARGVRGMNLAKGGRVIALLVAENESQGVLTATENGYGKRTPIAEYTRHGRGTQGMIAIQTSERNGKVVAATLVSPEVQQDRSVIFRFWAPQVSEVTLSGNWMGSQPPVPLVKGADGVWTVTVSPLEPNIYSYGFLVNGVRTTDPSCRCSFTSASRFSDSILTIPANPPRSWEPQNRPPGTLHHERFYSALQQRMDESTGGPGPPLHRGDDERRGYSP